MEWNGTLEVLVASHKDNHEEDDDDDHHDHTFAWVKVVVMRVYVIPVF